MPSLYLASASPRRRELLKQIGVPFSVAVADIDETVRAAEPAEDYVQRLALEKARAVQQRLQDPHAYVLGADTSVVLDGQILGKPRDQAEAMAMLMALADRTHQVLTAVALVGPEVNEALVVCSEVQFGPISHAQALAYWHTQEPCDKAGSYGIQGLGAVFVQHLRGSYSAVVGLPLYETAALLAKYGIDYWQAKG